MRKFFTEEKNGITDFQFGMNYRFAFVIEHALELLRAECLFVIFNRLRTIFHNKMRCQCMETIRDRFYFVSHCLFSSIKTDNEIPLLIDLFRTHTDQLCSALCHAICQWRVLFGQSQGINSQSYDKERKDRRHYYFVGLHVAQVTGPLGLFRSEEDSLQKPEHVARA